MSEQEILDKYNYELNHYIKDVYPGFLKYLENNRKPYIDFLKNVHQYYLFSAFLVDEKFKQYQKKFHPIFTFYSKAFISLNGIHNLLYSGIISEASTLLRSIFENLITIEIILEKDSNFRLKLFSEYKYVEKWLNFKENKLLSKKSVDELKKFRKTFSEEKINEIERNYLRVKDNYHPTKPYHWAWILFKSELNNRNPSIKFFCDKLNRKEDYLRVYSILSISVHGSSTVENLMRVNDSITVTPIFNKHIYFIGGLAVNFCSQIITKVVDFLDLPIKNEIKIYSSEFALDLMKYKKYFQ